MALCFETGNIMPTTDKLKRTVSYAMSGLVIAFMLFDAGSKLVPLDVVIKSTAELGYAPSTGLARGLGALALVCTMLYAFPRTAALGAILLTGYMGGAVASHLRVGDPLFTHILFGVYLGLLIWGGLSLRAGRVGGLIPHQRPPSAAPRSGTCSEIASD